MRAVVVYRTDGLGSRLMAFGNGLRLARVLGVPCYLTWNEPHLVGGISDLGHLLDMQRLPPDVKVRRLVYALKELDPSRMLYGRSEDVLDREAVAGSDVLLCVFSRMQRFSDEVDSPRLAEDFATAASCIVPVPALVGRARSFAARCDLRAAVGVHVRRGDLVGHPMEQERIRLVELDRYFAVLDAVAPDRRFFLCTEDQSVIGAFEARYPARVYHYPARSWARRERVALADALIEMFLLSGTQFIVAGPSAFSRFAAARRAIPLVVLQNGESVEQSIAAAEVAAREARLRQSRVPRPVR
jgi:hypothetical protein